MYKEKKSIEISVHDKIGLMQEETTHVPITITELKKEEVNELLADKIYSRFSPVKCNNCGKTSGFNRRIFRIIGVKKNKHSDEGTQNFLAYHFFHKHKVHGVFFRTDAKNSFYADSASCQACNSMNIVGDLVVDSDTLMAELTNFLEKSNQKKEE